MSRQARVGFALMLTGVALGIWFAFADRVFNGGDVLALVVLFAGWGLVIRNDIRRGL